MPMEKLDLKDHYMLCDYASKRLKQCGFELAYVSRKSEACYYKLADHRGYLRVAVHKFSRNEAKEIEFSNNPTISALTFSLGTTYKTLAAVDTAIMVAVGRFILKQEQSFVKKKKFYKTNYKNTPGISAQHFDH